MSDKANQRTTRITSVLTAWVAIAAALAVGPLAPGAEADAGVDTTRCVISPSTSVGSQSGVTAVATGEQLSLATEVDLEAGPVYQDILADPDGSTYVASWIGIEPRLGAPAPADLVLTIDGVPQTLLTGTEPSPNGFVLDSSQPLARVYFPGDPAALADPTGSGQVSFVVPAGGSTMRLAYVTAVPTGAAPGAVLDAIGCQAAVSYGEANASVDQRDASVAVLGLDVVVDKSADLPVLAPSSTVTYSVVVSVPQTDASGAVRNGTAYDTVVTDRLPAGLAYVAGSASNGGAESAGTITWNLAELAPGASVTLTYQATVPANAGAGTTYVNDVDATTTSQPGAVPGEGTATAAGDSVSLSVGAAPPAIDKSANVAVAGTNQVITYTVALTWPAGSTWYDVTGTDVLPDGIALINGQTGFTCAPIACPGNRTTLASVVETGGSTRFGFFVPQVGPFAAPQTWTWTYTGRMLGTRSGATPVPLGTALDNLAELRFDLIPRLGGATPNLAHLNTYDGVVGDHAPVTFNRPVVAIDKTGPAAPVDPGPSGVTYTVTLTNSGGVNATNVTFTDAGPASTTRRLGSIQAASVTGATYNATTGVFTVASVPAGGTATVTYAVIGNTSDTVADDDPYTNTATVTGYRDPPGNTYTDATADSAQVSVLQPDLDLVKQRISPSPIAGTAGQVISYRLTITNSSAATATAITGTDAPAFPGTRAAGTCTPGLTLSAAGVLSAAQLVPGASASCDYTVTLTANQPEGDLVNTASIAWKNGIGQTAVWDDVAGAVVPFSATASATTTVVRPSLALQKTPDADSPGNTILNGDTASYVITVTNVGPVAATGVVVSDTLPAGLTLNATPGLIVLAPSGGTIGHTTTGAFGDDDFQVTIPTLDVGASVQITVPVKHDGVAPADDQLINTAQLTADGLAAPISDTGVLQWLPKVNVPTAVKTVEPASASIGESVTWTVTATVPENTVPMYDVTIVDTLPRGTVFGVHGTVACVTGPLCATAPAPTPLSPVVLPTGETRVGWFVGDVAATAGNGATTYRFTFTSQIAATYSGAGAPAAGTTVTDTNLSNRIQPWFTLDGTLDRYGAGATPDLGAANLATQFERRGVPTTTPVHVTSPRIDVAKAVINHGPAFKWSKDGASGVGWTASAGDAISYQLTFVNGGSATAYDIVAGDSAGATAGGGSMLRDIAVGALPAGVTVTDGWSLTDPDIVLHIDQLAAGQSVTVTYTGVVAPSAELVPGFSGDNRDIALIDNAASVSAYRSAPGAGGLLFANPTPVHAQVYVYTPSPWIPNAAACVGSTSSPAGTTGTFSVIARNGAPPAGLLGGTLLTTGYPPNPAVGVGEDATLTIALTSAVRYVAGTAKTAGTAIPDPTSSVDANGVQTLVFDLGDLPQNQSKSLTFGVRTIVANTSGGMTATLTMRDASGATSRGTAVPGAEYVYEHVQSRGCDPAVPLTIRKFPDQTPQFTGQKLFKVGETVTWTGDVFGGGSPYHDGEIVDTMPDGIDYTPGSTVFTVVTQASTVVASVANGNLTEDITSLPGGRTQLRFTSPAFASFDSMSYTMQSVVGSDAIVGALLTNVIDLHVSDVAGGSCADALAAVCDNGQVRIISSADPRVVKSVGHASGPWGDTFPYTVDVTLPANTPYFDAFIADRGDYPRHLDGTTAASLFAGAVVQCVSGCPGTDALPAMLPVYRETGATADELSVAWYLGDLDAQPTDRVYRITYTQTFKDTTEFQAEFGTAASTQTKVNTAVAGWNDANTLIDVNYRPGGSSFTAASSRALATGVNRGSDDAQVTLIRPDLAVDKTCHALVGSDNAATSTSTGGETTGSAPNFRCVLTARNPLDPATGVTVVDPVFTDTLPATSSGARPVTWQVTSIASSDPVLSVTQNANTIVASGIGIELAPGESVTVTLDLQLTASSAFWTNTALSAEQAVNRVAATTFKDTQGNSYAGTSVDTWNLVIAKPKISVSERGFGPGFYESSLADPTACLAYSARGDDPPTDLRFAGNSAQNPCTDLLYARDHPALVAGGFNAEYRRAYAGYGFGAPDAVPGETDHLTWAVDVAVQSPGSFPTISVTDQIPYGFEYVPGSARLAEWRDTGTTHTPLADPTIGANPNVTCQTPRNFSNNPNLSGIFIAGRASYGHAPWTPLTWTFANGAAGAAGAFWNDGLTYLNGANRDAAGVLPTAAPFDRLVRVVFDIRLRAEFGSCLRTPGVANTFRAQAVATGTHSRGTSSSTSLGWVVGAQLAAVDKTPDNGISPDGTTATYGVDVTITDTTRIDLAGGGTNVVQTNSSLLGPPGCPNNSPVVGTPPKPVSPSRTPWFGLGDVGRNGPGTISTYGATPHADGTYRTDLVVTDIVVDDGQYVPGTATFDMRDPWGRPFAGHLQSEVITPLVVGGRQAKQITWTFDYYPAPVGVGASVATFPCGVDRSTYVTYPSSMHIAMPLPIADGTADGTAYPNTAEVTTNHYVGGALALSQSDEDDGLVTVRNPLPPPPATKVAVPDEVAPGATFDWVVTAQLQANGTWFDLGWTDTVPASMELVGYGTPTCVLAGTSTPCAIAPVTATTLTPVHNADGSTTVGWFLGDVGGAASARTVSLPVRVRFVGPEAAGDQLTNSVVGFSDEDDAVTTITTPADPASFTYRSAPIVGTADVVEPHLTIGKAVTSGPGPYAAGATVTYSITVTNDGGATAFDVPVTDTPDPTLVSVNTTSALRSKGWTAADPRLEWFLPTLAPGAVVHLDVTGVVAANYIDRGVVELTNEAAITEYTSRPATDPRGRAYPSADAATTVPLVAPNLVVVKHAGSACTSTAHVFQPGDPVAWCVDVTNTGTAPSFHVTLTDLLPPGWTYEAGSARIDGASGEPTISAAAGGGQRLLWSVGDIAPNGTHRLTYRTVPADGDSSVTNTAIADSTLADGTPLPRGPKGFRSQSQAFAVAAGSGLQLAKLPDAQDVDCDRLRGCDVTWQIVVVNAGTTALSAATVVDSLPAGLTYGTSTSAPGWSAAVVGADGSGPSGTTPVTWTRAGTLAPGATATFDITAHVSAPVAQDEFLNHAVAGASGVPDVENQALVRLHFPELDIVKTSTATASSRPGDTVTYTITATNTGDAPYTAADPAVVIDDLSALADDATYNADVTADRSPVAPTFDDPRITWAGALAVGDTVTITYTATLRAGGDGVVRNTAFQSACDPSAAGCVPTPPALCVLGSDPVTGLACAVDVFPLPKLTLTKRADRVDLPLAGQTVTYTVTVRNVGPGDYTATDPATFTDDLSDVLDDATIDVASVNATTGQATFTASQLSWSGVLLAGQTADITYTLTYTGSGDQRLVNVACAPAAEMLDPADPCRSVQIPGSGLQQRKSADPPNGASVDSGDTVTYTLYFENVGATGATVDSLDDLSGVLDEATLDAASIVADAGLAAAVEGSGIRVTGTVAAGTTATVRYAVTVDAFAAQDDHVLHNSLGCPTGSPPGCLPATTDHPVRHLTLTKVSDAQAGVDTGTVVGYTLVVRNDGAGDFTALDPAVVTDDLTDVLDDAVLDHAATATSGTVSYAAPVLRWSGPLAGGATATITYGVTVTNLGDHDLENVAAVVGCTTAPCAPAPVITALPHVVPGKASTPTSGAAVAAGDIVTYTLTWTNDGQVAGIVDSTDDLAGVLDDADLLGAPVANRAGVQATVVGGSIRISGPIQVGDTVTVTYQVRVRPDGAHGDNVIRNQLVADDPQVTCTAPVSSFAASCRPRGPATTTHPVGELAVSKTSNPPPGTVVQPGSSITYTLTFTNVSAQGPVPVDQTDHLADVLDDATLTGGVVSGDPALSASLAGDTIHVVGQLPPSRSVTVVGGGA